MMLRLIISVSLAVGLTALGPAAGRTVFVTPSLILSALDDRPTIGPLSMPDQLGSEGSAATSPAPRGNPLWGIPLRTLSVTREHPIFSPSRRAPPPAVVGVSQIRPVKLPSVAAAPERPQFSLVGTVLGDNEGIGVFFEQNTNKILRLKTGENHGGWILQAVRSREATLQKGSETVVLAFPPPAPAQGGPIPAMHPMPRLPTPTPPATSGPKLNVH